ncbi:MAG: DUF2905 domain-containing protein [Planctomycetaceae bacterium]|nr:DUF2905 domain-containing protein [Planctomycetaceae bacterium]
MGKLLIAAGLVLVAAGVLWMLGERLGLGRLPGDIVIRGERSAFYTPDRDLPPPEPLAEPK